MSPLRACELLDALVPPPWDLSEWESLAGLVDAVWEVATTVADPPLNCRPGCYHCCLRMETLLPVEWAVLHQRGVLETAPIGGLRSHLHPNEVLCSLLALDGSCRAFDSRPVLCRTHGLFLLQDQAVVSTCIWNDRDEVTDELVWDPHDGLRALQEVNATFVQRHARNDPMRIPGRRVHWESAVFGCDRLIFRNFCP